MKKKVAAILIIILSIVAFGACKYNSSNSGTEYDYPAETYYGCPNSKRVKKLNIRKRRY